MRICILGSGAVGYVIAAYFAEVPGVSLVASDIDVEKAKLIKERFGEGIEAVGLDADDYDALSNVVKGCSLAVNALPPECNLNVMRACLENGVNYLDMASGTIAGETIDESMEKQLALDKEWKDKGLKALISCGATPGLTNILARDGVDSLDKATRITILSYSSMESDEPVSFWSPITALRDLAACPLVFVDGDFKRFKPFEGEEKLNLPGISEAVVFYHEHEEVSTLPRFIKGLEVAEFKMGNPHITKSRVLYENGLFSEEPVKVGDSMVSPLEVIAALQPPVISAGKLVEKIKSGKIRSEGGVLRVEVEGEKDGKKVTRAYDVDGPDLQTLIERIPDCNPVSYVTGLAAAAFARAMLDGLVKPEGVFAPECLDVQARKFIYGELDKYDIRPKVS